ncbi:MAG TPA: hypothetical protein VMR70_02520 [Flavisolibacter sp.]|nr:hypothetical protein [Flavisolibacter sp.]
MTIYVAQFDLDWKDEDLKNLFAPHGDVETAKVEMDAFTDRSRGFGYVEMPDDSQARTAIGALNNADLNGKKITVQEAEPKELKRGSYKVGNGGVNPYRFKKS